MKRRFDGTLPGDLLLQRRLRGDCSKWRTASPFRPEQAPAVQRAAEVLAAINPSLGWRVVDGAAPMRVLAQWDGSSWAV